MATTAADVLIEPIHDWGVDLVFGLPGPILDEALRVDGPVIVDAIVDPHEPPMPPRVTMDQAAHFAEALLRGTPNRERIALTALSNTVRELV